MALDPKFFFYSDGTITLVNGSDIATGDMVFWDTAVLPFDTLYPNDGQNGVTVIKEVLSLNELRLAKPWTGPDLLNVPYFVLRWVRHTDPKVYAVRVSEYLTRLKAIPDNIEEVAGQITADRQVIEAAMTTLQQIEQAVDADRQAVETAAGAAQQAAAAAAGSATTAQQWAEAASSGVLPDNGVTNTKLADMAANTIKGRLASTGDPEDIPLVSLIVALGGVGNPRAHYYGGTLRALHKGLTNPLEQFSGIVFIGDSITWGTGASNTATSTPRATSLADPRDNFASNSFVNLFKRYIGDTYFKGAAPSLSNWSGSPSGQSVVTYKRTTFLYPGKAPFTTTQTGASVSVTDLADAQAKLGFQYIIADGNTAGTSVSEITIPNFTGTKIALWYTQFTDGTTYQLFVNGVSQGTFSTNGALAYQQRREHTFGFVRDKTITIRLVRHTNVGNLRLRLEAIEIEKTCRVMNNGIVGAAARNYPSGAAFTEDTYIFVQLGTNDRIITTSVPNDPLTFKERLAAQITNLAAAGRSFTLMSGIPTTNENPATYAYTMAEVRDMVRMLAQDSSFDFIDAYAAFTGQDLSVVLADGLHPNDLGHAFIARNIISALEAS